MDCGNISLRCGDTTVDLYKKRIKATKYYKLATKALDFLQSEGETMAEINNLRQIREIYGATQEQVAKAIAVNRVTVANWEAGNSIASSANREKLSLYYGIGPEYFYEKPLDEDAKKIVKESADAAESGNAEGEHLSKEEAFGKLFESLTFSQALSTYTLATKMMMATADQGKLDKLKTAYQINQKIGRRLEMMIQLREEEDEEGESLHELLKEVETTD